MDNWTNACIVQQIVVAIVWTLFFWMAWLEVKGRKEAEKIMQFEFKLDIAVIRLKAVIGCRDTACELCAKNEECGNENQVHCLHWSWKGVGESA